MTDVNGEAAPFDIASVGLTRSETGSPFTLFHPGTRMPLLGSDKNPITITLAGQFSDRWQDSLRAIQLERSRWHARAAARAVVINEGKSRDQIVEADPIPTKVLEQQDTEQLVACTLGWSIELLDGQPYLFSEENARKLWADRRFAYLREPAMRFILADGNFLSAGSMPSSDTQGSSSEP